LREEHVLLPGNALTKSELHGRQRSCILKIRAIGFKAALGANLS